MHTQKDFDDLLRKFVKTLSPEERTAGLSLRERLDGLTLDELVPLMPDEMLRALRPDFIATLAVATREAIRKRLGG